MTQSIGTYYADIRPNADGFVERMRGPVLPQMDQFGRDAGERFAAAFGRIVQDRIADPFTRSRPDVDRRSRDSGRSAGDAFGRELDTRITAAIRALPDIRPDVDLSEADRKLAEIRAQMTALSAGHVRLGLSDDDAIARLGLLRGELEVLTGKDHPIRVRMDAAAAEAQLAALQAGISDLDSDGAKKLGRSLDDANKRGGGLLKTLLLLAPALVPIGGAAIAAGGAAAAGLGAVALAIGGIRAEMKAGTADGIAYAGGLGVLKTDLQSLEQVAASGVLKPFDQSVTAIHEKTPQLRADFAQTSAEMGDIGQKLIGGVVAGFHTFNPLVQEVLGDVDRLAGKFEAWESGPGGSKFAQTLATDLEHVGPALSNIGHLVTTILSGLNGPGLSELDLISRFAGDLAELPPGMFTALATGYVAFRTAVSITSGIDRATASWLRLGAAEREAAAGGAGAGARGAAAGGFVGKLSRGLGVGLGVDLGLQFLGTQAENSGWNQSTNRWKLAAGHIGSGLGDLARFDFGGAWSNLFGSQRASDERLVQQLEQARTFNDQYRTPAAVSSGFGSQLAKTYLQGLAPAAETSSASGGSVAPLTYIQSLARAMAGYRVLVAAVGKEQAKALSFGKTSEWYALTQAPETLADRTRRLQTGNYDTAVAGTNLAQAVFDVGTQRSTLLSQSSSGYDQIDTSLQKAIDTRSKWLTQGGQEVFQYKGLSIGQKTWAAAMRQTNGDQAAARALILSNVDAMGHQQTQLDVNTIRQQRINTALAEAETKYKLTADQVDTYSTVLGISVDTVGRGIVSQRQFLTLIGDTAKQLSNSTTSVQAWVAAVQQFSQSEDTAASRGALIGEALRATNGDTIAFQNNMVKAATANQQFVTDLANAKKGIVDLKTGTIDYHNAAAAPLLQDLQAIQDANVQAAAAVYQHELATRGGTKAADDAFQTYETNTRGQLLDEATKLLGNATAAKKFVDQYMGIHNAPDIKKQIEMIGQDKTQAALAGILEDLDALSGLDHSQVFNFDVNVSSNVGLGTLSGIVNHGSVTRGGTHIEANGGVLDYYATGGIREQHVAQIAPAGAMRLWAEPETGGEGYVPLARSKWTRSREVTKEIARRLGGFAEFFETGGFHGVDYGSPSSSASSSLAHGSSSGPSASQVTQLTGAVRDGVAAMMKALFGATAQLASSERSLAHAADRAGAAQSVLDTLARERTTLLADSALLARTNSEITKTQTYLTGLEDKYGQLRSSITSSAGAFDVTAAGTRPQVYNDVAARPVSITTITADAHARVATAIEFRKELDAARSKGLNLTDYQQLASGDPTQEADQLKAFATATPAQIKAYNAARASLQRVSGYTGRDVAGQVYGSQLDTARALLDGFDPSRNPSLAASVKSLADSLFGAGKYAARGLSEGLLDEKSGITSAMKHLADVMAHQLEADLDMHSPSEVMRDYGRQVPRGLALGIVDDIPVVRDAAARMALHAQPVTLHRPNSTSGASGGQSAGWTGHIELHGGIVDAADLVRQIDRQIYHALATQRLAGV